ncbi:hypothetical protein [Actinomyces succiniciruminis]|uniref:Prokaryotic membrane lipoprotein lipid attachment site profile n=1 Tax=Actinomyces succiniciruminis TaxID=1522002 RepID=A0A1L7RJA1_9ACTO|nr:hypothetical protein [Actinomyces succiniciruminis]CED90020.1 Prokaryotic membrane lipoprotein lipid attachment site profile [Actinomyces succiniciruminis]
MGVQRFARSGRVFRGAAVGAIFTLLVCSCSSGGQYASVDATAARSEVASQVAAPPGPTEVLGVVKDPVTWSVPFDRVLDGNLSRLENYAYDLLVDRCMSEAGIDEYEVMTASSVPFPETSPHGNETLFNVEIAQKYGYRMAPDPAYKISWEKIDLQGGGYYDGKPDSFKDQWHDCQDEVQLELYGPPPTEYLDIDENGVIPIESQLNQFFVDTSSSQLQEAAAQWRTCMAPQGIADLPEEPWEVGTLDLPESLITRFDYWPTGDPSADEIVVATADAECRESSGWTSLLYEATWDQQAAFVADHQAEIEGMVAENEAEAARMRSIITEAGGTP